MRKIAGIILGIFFLLLFLKPQFANAAIDVSVSQNPILVNDGNQTITLTSNPASFIKDKNYTFTFFADGETVRDKNNLDPAQVSDFNARSIIVKPENCQGDRCAVLQAVQDWRNYRSSFNPSGPEKKPGAWKVVVFLDNFNSGKLLPNPIEFTMLTSGDAKIGIPAIGMEHSIFQAYTPAKVYILNPVVGKDYTLWFEGQQSARWSGKVDKVNDTIFKDAKGSIKGYIVDEINMGDASAKNLCMSQASATFNSVVGLKCEYRLKGIVVTTLPPEPGAEGGKITSNEAGFPLTLKPSPVPGPCDQWLDGGKQFGFCKTALGDIHTDPATFVKDIFGRVLSLAGGVAIILIIFSGYRLMSSGANPEKVQAAREQLTSAIVGLLFIIFSLSLLQIIGVDILHIPGINK